MNSTDNPRDFVEKLDQLIRERIAQSQPYATTYSAQRAEEDAELLKRDLTDYLLQNDKRTGVFVKGKND